MNVGFVSTRLAGTDGVSLETAKLVTVLRRIGHDSFYCAGELEQEGPPGFLVPEMHFVHPEARRIYDESFGIDSPGVDLRRRIEAMATRLKKTLASFVDRFSIDVLFLQNVSSIPMHIPLGVAVTQYIQETGMPTIAHHHDFSWERERFAVCAVPDIVETCFPPDLPGVQHLVINSLAREALLSRRGIFALILPNIFDFETPPPDPDEFISDLRSELGIGPGDYLILQPTRVIPRKGIELAIEMLQRLGDRRCQLVITHPAGDEGFDYLEKLRAMADRSGVAMRYVADRFAPRRNVDQNGYKTYSLWDAYLNADLVTFPSRVEGFGNALLETIYFRLPAMVNRYPVYEADIAPLGFEFVEIEGRITDQAVESVRYLLDDVNDRRRVVEHNFQLGAQHFSYSNAETILAGILDSLAR